MSTVTSDFLHELKTRGYIHQCTDETELDKLARSETITGYIGFDCTAPSLHVGNLVSIMLLRKLQQTGHRPIVLIGGGTTKVGDPSGKDEARKLLTDAEIGANIAGIESVFSKFLSFGHGKRDGVMVNNDDRLAALEGAELNEAKKILATEATALVHGRDAADRAAATARTTFEQGQTSANLPSFEVARADLEKGLGVLNASVLAGFVQSTGEARRQIKGGGIKVNDVAVTDERQSLTLSDLTDEGVIKLSLGKKRHALIRPCLLYTSDAADDLLCVDLGG